MNKIALGVLFSAVAAFADGFGIYAEGPAPMTNFGIVYASGMFGIKNGYNYTHTHSESKNDSMKTSESDAYATSVEVAPMLIINANILNIELSPAYQISFSNSKSTFYSASVAGGSSTTDGKSTSHALKMNVLLSKEFAERYKLGVGSNVFRYSFGDSESENKSTSGTITKSKTQPSGYSDGLLFYIHFSVYFI